MSSGQYSALSGARAKMQMLEVIGNNLANAKTAGYKKDRLSFESLIDGLRQGSVAKGRNFTRIENTFTDYRQGGFEQSGNNLDLAINGPGFFKIAGEGGNFYSRQGNFRLDPDGLLINGSGFPVLGTSGQQIRLRNDQVTIDSAGRIFDGENQVGEIGVFEVDDLAQIAKRGNGFFAPGPETIERRVDAPQLLQGQIESSNVNPLEEMTLLMDTMRSFEAYQKVLKTYNTIGGKLDELGSVG